MGRVLYVGCILFYSSLTAALRPVSLPPVRILTWNLLAPIYADSSSLRHRNTKPQNGKDENSGTEDDWSWSRRQPAICQLIRQAPTNDIVCLQEVQRDVWDDFVAEFEDEYTCLLQNVSAHHPVACAVLVRRHVWKVRATESRSRALLVILEPRDGDCVEGSPLGSEDPLLYVACVHLDAGKDKDETRWNQLKSLFQRILKHRQAGTTSLGKSRNSNDDDLYSFPLVIAGDFNIWRTENALYQALATGNLQKLPWCSLPPSAPWTRLLPLTNAFGNHRTASSTLRQPTFAGGSILDYIWMSNVTGTYVEQTWSLFPDRTVGTAPDNPDLYPIQMWPSAQVPSDHIPIGASVLLTGDGGCNPQDG